MKATNNPAIDQFIMEALLVDPISKIVNQLNNRDFRDCDIKWLDNKLEKYMLLTAKTLGINGLMNQADSVKPQYMCDYAYGYYLKYFSQLLEYFKQY